VHPPIRIIVNDELNDTSVPYRSPQESQTSYLGRQPIINWRQDLIGHEILFRSNRTNLSTFGSEYEASARVINNILTDFGIQEVLGPHKGFFNVGYEFLLNDRIELLPAKATVIEIQDTVPLNEEVLKRCLELKAKGYQIAMGSRGFDPDLLQLYQVADYIKVDILTLPSSELPPTAKALGRSPFIKVAEKVETHEQFKRCRELGFNLFQGFFFAKPEILATESLLESRVSVLNLLRLVVADADILEIENAFKKNLVMTYKLLRLVNSVMTGVRYKIESVRHALTILGQSQLKRWILLSVFAEKDSRVLDNPLFELAAIRGRLMEALVQTLSPGAANLDLAGAAFITGLLSLVNLVLNVSVVELCEQLNLDPTISAALINRSGLLGDLLQLTESLERDEPLRVDALAGKIGLGRDTLLTVQLESIKWVNAM
jgi:EAL and modified HD-GYP domain-containing signal transduction protein